ncbi:integrase [Streptomyces yangpuensis]|uniref:tyrosine-type recombinase/integrase n=1 Tax=Streptomyces yangpuensis TaxID=1648182 RepID=UPI00343DE62C
MTQRRRPVPREPRPLLVELMASVDMAVWLDREGIPDGTPFLLSPAGEYDSGLHGYGTRLMAGPVNTQLAFARDMKGFANFLWHHRPEVPEGISGSRPRTWKDATSDDRSAYEVWRNRDPAGPLVAGSTWNREVATVDGFYKWAGRQGLVAESPIAQRVAREVRGRRGRSGSEEVADEKRPDARRHRLDWLPPKTYRAFRDVGIRGYLPSGLRDPAFRGRRTARNAAFADYMIRTGLRLEEQSSLTLYELPDRDGTRAYYRSWLPKSVAKWDSARDVYVPDGVLRSVFDYVEIDRAEAVERAQAAGRYERIWDALVIEDPARPQVRVAGRWVGLEDLQPEQRRRLLVAGERGLEPAALWLSEDGMPLTLHTWKYVFREASRRCRALGLRIHCHPHALRHSFAVITLEQLQRAHLRSLGELSEIQRRHYTLIWGDPLDWVRIRLGHASIETTQIYLHTLKRLEMETRMALVPDRWEDLDAGYRRDLNEVLGWVAA